jgi:hypothetical protein
MVSQVGFVILSAAKNDTGIRALHSQQDNVGIALRMTKGGSVAILNLVPDFAAILFYGI